MCMMPGLCFSSAFYVWSTCLRAGADEDILVVLLSKSLSKIKYMNPVTKNYKGKRCMDIPHRNYACITPPTHNISCDRCSSEIFVLLFTFFLMFIKY